MILKKSGLSYDSVKSIMTSVRRLSSINIENILAYRSHSDINDICARLNTLKKKSTDAFRPFISNSTTKTLCHSMGNPLKVAEDIIELEEENDLLNSLLKIVTFLSNKYATVASIAALIGPYKEWKSRGAEFITEPKDHDIEIRCYIRDPDGYLIEVGQTTGGLKDIKID
jgi:hypothetical protein